MGGEGHRIGVLVWPGSNCERDVYHVLKDELKSKPEYVWYKRDDDLGKYEALILPGGFTYGDRLRAGIIAANTDIVKRIRKYANDGKPVMGICNGFQILTESEILPGALIKNGSRKFECRWTYLEVGGIKTPFTGLISPGEKIRIPVANGEGNYYNTPEGVREMEKKGQIIFKYTKEDDPSGSKYFIAGVSNDEGNVVGLMPHPDRASNKVLGGDDGMKIFESLIDYLDKA